MNIEKVLLARKIQNKKEYIEIKITQLRKKVQGAEIVTLDMEIIKKQNLTTKVGNEFLKFLILI